MSAKAINSHENRSESMAEVGAAAAALAFVIAAARYTTTAIVGPWPEIFVGPIGAVWWGIFGASLAVAAYCGIAAAIIMCRGE